MPVPNTNIKMTDVRQEILGNLTGSYYSPANPSGSFSLSSPIYLRDLFYHSTLSKTAPHSMNSFAGYVHKPFVTLGGRLTEGNETSTKLEAVWAFQNPTPKYGYIQWSYTDSRNGSVVNMNSPFSEGTGTSFTGLMNSPVWLKGTSPYTVTFKFLSSSDYQLQGADTHVMTIPADASTYVSMSAVQNGNQFNVSFNANKNMIMNTTVNWSWTDNSTGQKTNLTTTLAVGTSNVDTGVTIPQKSGSYGVTLRIESLSPSQVDVKIGTPNNFTFTVPAQAGVDDGNYVCYYDYNNCWTGRVSNAGYDGDYSGCAYPDNAIQQCYVQFGNNGECPAPMII